MRNLKCKHHLRRNSNELWHLSATYVTKLLKPYAFCFELRRFGALYHFIQYHLPIAIHRLPPQAAFQPKGFPGRQLPPTQGSRK